MKLVVDSSALLAIRMGEPERQRFHEILLASEPLISVATLAEATMVWQARFGAGDLPGLDRLIDLYAIAIEPVTVADHAIFRDAIVSFARGRAAEPAPLDFGDLFAYCLARRLRLPLLYKGEDFARTDVQSAA